MHVLILGGDGYLGWPTAMYFSRKGCEVTVVDNYFRRNACRELGVELLYPVPPLPLRAERWHGLTGREIKVVIGDLSDPETLRGLFQEGLAYDWAVDRRFTGVPDTVVHYAEQPSAPYSQIDHRHADFTLLNNLRVTNNLMFAVRDFARESHIIKLGTMGEYGTPNIDIEEGWIDITHKGRQDRFLFPRQASSLYHTTKIMDTDLLWFGVRMWQLRVTDLMQGPVYGIETQEARLHDDLRTLFNYDEIFGTVLNRFIVQAVSDFPLTIYGRGGQTRGYLNLMDTLQCVWQAAKMPAAAGELRIFNQIMETFSVGELARRVQQVGRTMGYDVRLQTLANPRCEAEQHYYNPVHQGLRAMGVTPHLLTDEVLADMFDVAARHRENIRRETIFRGIRWNP